jgi:hypothetical protein
MNRWTTGSLVSSGLLGALFAALAATLAAACLAPELAEDDEGAAGPAHAVFDATGKLDAADPAMTLAVDVTDLR